MNAHGVSHLKSQRRGVTAAQRNREEALKEAIKHCEKHGILRVFLKLHAGEVRTYRRILEQGFA